MAQITTSQEPPLCVQFPDKPRGFPVKLWRDQRVRVLVRSIAPLLKVSPHLPQARATYRASYLLLDRPKRPPVATPNSSKNVVGTVEVDSVHPRPRTKPPPRRQASESHLPRNKSSSVGRSPQHGSAQAVSQHDLAPIVSMPTVASVPSATLSSAMPSGLNPHVSASYYAQGLGVLNSRASTTVHWTPPSLPPPRHCPPAAAPTFLQRRRPTRCRHRPLLRVSVHDFAAPRDPASASQRHLPFVLAPASRQKR